MHDSSAPRVGTQFEHAERNDTSLEIESLRVDRRVRAMGLVRELADPGMASRLQAELSF